MSKKILINILFFVGLYSQTINVTVLESYLTGNEKPQIIIYFFSDDSCFSKINFKNSGLELKSIKSTEHRFTTDLNKFKPVPEKITGYIYTSSDNETFNLADSFEVEHNFDIKEANENQDGFLKMCCLGSTIIGLPYPALIQLNKKNYFGINKEIALLTIKGSGYNYPAGYFALDYTYIFNAPTKNILRFGYKHLFELPVFEYISPGVNGITDFKGNNGIAGELSFGILKISDVFTLYSRYRYNYIPKKNDKCFHEITIGLYSSFFSLNL